MDSFFNNSISKKVLLDLYYSKLKSLNLDYNFITVETSFGDTNIVITGKESNPPLVVIHGENSCAPVAMERLKGLDKRFRIFAIDVLGQPNLSEEVRLNTESNDYGKWMYEIVSRLHLHNAYLVGFSFGGYICLKSLGYDERRFAKAFLVNPAGIIRSSWPKAFVKGYLPLMLFKIKNNNKWLKRYIKNTFSDEDVFMTDYMSTLILTYAMNSIFMPNLTKQVLETISTPIHIIASKRDYLFPGKRLIKQAEKFFPSLQHTVLLPNAKHVLNQEENNKIIKLIVEFSTTSN